MPGFTFLIRNPRIFLEAKEDSEEWSLSFDATIERPECDHHGYGDEFTVFCDGKEYDGFEMDGGARIELDTPKTRLSLPAELQKKPGYIRVS